MKRDFPFLNADIEVAFDAFDEMEREHLLAIRKLIYELAKQDKEVGTIVESLKWGQPSYDTKPRTGTPIRLGMVKSAPDHVALFAHCQSNVMAVARLHYEDHFSFEGNRALLIPTTKALPIEAVSHVIRIALRYRLKA
ncbi:DUF1801 domain-containing protein [Cohaesibacter gelatinilyticus]|uniref:YdhG-like domain-containing protein n=1 Tax=Cohaesibacter gelatinilyticus TaxID=372072 RepID=A0A285PKW6_9HYPH|nr:DUF1801 domain-containing protein [Cohaesibacter gelatinilyticus]SNZ20511.1 protein of unknown function (DU1801) [Cohaesibacter gelatinilyticus]